MLKKLLFFALALILSVGAYAQTVDAFKYQAVLRSGGTQVIANQNVGLRFSIREASPNGVEVYSEEHQVVTNPIGLVNLEIGNGQNVFGDMRTLNWGDERYFVRTELDAAGGSNYVFLGVSELLAVPYAFKAGDVVQKQDLERTGDSVRITDNDNATWLDLRDLRDNTDDQSMRFQNGLVILSRELTEDTADLNPYIQARLNQFGLDSVLGVNNQAAGQSIENVGRIGIGTTAGNTLHIVDTVDQLSPNYSYSIFGQISGGNTAGRTRAGMYLEMDGSDGENMAIDGTSLGNSAGTNTGVGGFARGSSSVNRGVQASGDGGQQAIGVEAQASGGSQQTIGVYGQASNGGSDQAGVRGFIDSAGTTNVGRNWGVNGFVLTESPNLGGNIGVEGAAEGSHNGENIGVRGQAVNSGTNVGGAFAAGPSTLGGTNFSIGARGSSVGAGTGINYGLYGEATGSSNTNRGVIGVINGNTNRTGNLGLHLQDAAVYGLANGIGWNTAVLGRAIFANPTDTNIALLGNAANGSRNYALWTEIGDAMFNDTAIFNYGSIQNGYILTSDANGRATWQPNAADSTRLTDADNDTRVEVEQSTDDDLIRFTLGGTEYFRMNAGKLDILNTNSNTFIGPLSGQLFNLTSNTGNTGFGSRSLTSLTGGRDNTAIGSQALEDATNTSENTAIGRDAMNGLTTGGALSGGNTAVGFSSMNSSGGSRNVAIGRGALQNNPSGSNNVALGNQAGFNNTGSRNIFIGDEAGNGQLGSDQLFIENSSSSTPLIYGDFATDSLRLNAAVEIRDDLYLPTGATNGYVLTSDANGRASWQANAIDTLPIIKLNDSNYVEVQSAQTDIVIDNLTYFQFQKGRLLMSGLGNNVFIGNGAGNLNTISGRDVAIGLNALNTKVVNGLEDIAIGEGALQSYNASQSQNIAIGYRSLNALTSQGRNVAYGYGTFDQLTTGIDNVGLGFWAGQAMTSGDQNVFVGSQAGRGMTSGSRNVILGDWRNGATAHSASGVIKIGYQSGISDTNDNTLFIENSGSNTPLIFGDFASDSLGLNAAVEIRDNLYLPTGATNGYVLTSDANGKATWQAASVSDSTRIALNGTKAFIDPTDTNLVVNLRGTEAFRFLDQRIQIADGATYFGHNAGVADTGVFSSANVGIGSFALTSVVSGVNNVAIGPSALQNSTSGAANVAVGAFANLNNTTGGGNVAMGYSTLIANTTGGNNLALGSGALSSNLTGNDNTAIGYESGKKNLGGGNVYLGHLAGSLDSTGSNRLYIDNSDTFSPLIYGDFASDSLRFNGSITADSLYLPSGATNGYVLTSDANGKATWQAASGGDTLNIISDASNRNYAVINADSTTSFYQSGTEFVKLDSGRIEILNTGNSVMIGRGAGANEDYSANNQNVFVGTNAGNRNTTARFITAVGAGALGQNQTSNFNTAVGYGAMGLYTAGGRNTALGFWALRLASNVSQTISIGESSLANASSSNSNIAIGYEALLTFGSVGTRNVSIGNRSMKNVDNSSTSDNVAIGDGAMEERTRGAFNVALGTSALENDTSGSSSVAVGYRAGQNIQQGGNNVMIGRQAGRGSALHSKTGGVFIGNDAGANEMNSNKLYIDNSATTTPLIYGDFSSDSLRVNGTLFIRDGLMVDTANATNGYVLTSDANGKATWQAASTSSPQDIDSVLSVGSNAGNDSIYNLRMLGMGTSAPTATIDIVNNLDNFNLSIQNSKNTGAGEVKGVFSTVSGAGSSDKFGLYGEAINGTGTNYGVFGEARRSGGVGTAYGIYGTASGGANNWAGYFENGNVLIENSLGIGIGGAPAHALDVAGTALIDKILTDSAEVDTLITKLGFIDSLRIGSAYSFPSAAGTNGQILEYNGAGDLVWANAGSSEDSTRLADADNDTRVSVEEGADDDFIRFFNRGREYVTIDTIGRMGINMNSPSARLCLWDTLGAIGNKIVGINSNVFGATGAGTGDTLIANQAYASGGGEYKFGYYSKVYGGPTNIYYGIYNDVNGGAENYGTYNKVVSSNENYGTYTLSRGGRYNVGSFIDARGDGASSSDATGIELYVDSAELAWGIYAEVTSSINTGEAIGAELYTSGGEINIGAVLDAEGSGGGSDTAIGIYANAQNAAVNYAAYLNAGNVYIGDTLIIPGGAQNGYVLTSDADGKATWQTAAGGSSVWDTNATSVFLPTQKNLRIGGNDTALSDIHLGAFGHLQWADLGGDSSMLMSQNLHYDGTNLKYTLDGPNSLFFAAEEEAGIIVSRPRSAGTVWDLNNDALTSFRIDQGGVGINTDSPNYALDINPVNDSIGILINSNGVDASSILITDSSGGRFMGLRPAEVLKTSYQIVFPDTAPLQGQVMAYDSTARGMIWTTSGSSTCPAGMVNYGVSGCIDDAERTAATWFVADSTCISLGYQLADYGEWYGATSNASLVNETDNWEWVRNISQNNMMVVGNGGLTNRTFQDPTTTAPYRCTARID